MTTWRRLSKQIRHPHATEPAAVRETETAAEWDAGLVDAVLATQPWLDESAVKAPSQKSA